MTNDNIWEVKRIPAELLIPPLGPLVDANTDIERRPGASQAQRGALLHLT